MHENFTSKSNQSNVGSMKFSQHAIMNLDEIQHNEIINSRKSQFKCANVILLA